MAGRAILHSPLPHPLCFPIICFFFPIIPQNDEVKQLM